MHQDTLKWPKQAKNHQKKKVHFIAVTLNNDKKMQLTKILCEHEPFLTHDRAICNSGGPKWCN